MEVTLMMYGARGQSPHCSVLTVQEGERHTQQGKEMIV